MKKNSFLRKQQHGFTLIELVIVLLILGVLTAVAAPKLLDMVRGAEEVSLDYQAKQLINNNFINIARCASGHSNCVDIEGTGPEACETALDEFLPGVERSRYGVANISSAVPREDWRTPENWGSARGDSDAWDAINQDDGSVPWALYWVDRFLGESEPSASWEENWDRRQPCVIYLRQ
ncbi:prepilin-type N-terminal cleavage/methylation domain-containing protein [Halorhodospira abdelmalekii]|uniref:prepilin-type N-terminal cleavage/methylation domain-containing protein n=1 Tax=Halorhodospira abdelmalekii TaxID=421629 RepID=UPI001903B9E8